MGFQVRIGRDSDSADGSSLGLGGKLFGLIFGLVFLGAGSAFTYFIAMAAWQAVDSYSWEAVPGQVESSAIVVNEADESPFEVKITYSYQFKGESHRTSDYTLAEATYTEYADAFRELDAYRSGSRPNVYVNPKKPSQGVLVRGRLWLVPLILFPLIFVAVGLIVIYATFSNSEPKKPRRKKSISTSASDAKSAGKFGTRFGIGFCSIFVVVGAITFYAFFLNPMMTYLDSQSWQPTPAVVEYSRVRSHSSDDGTTYSIDILYAYRFKGKEYKSNQYTFFDFSSSGYSGKKEVVDEYPKGESIDVLVNPGDPVEAVVLRELTAGSFVGLFTLLFLLPGAAGMYGFWWAGRKNSQLSGGYDERGYRQRAEQDLSPRGELVLQTDSSGFARFVGVSLLAAFWNGITAFPVAEVVSSWQKGSPDWFLTLFVVPFALVGTALLVFVFYTFLAMFNPRPKLMLQSAEMALGKSYSVRWEFKGKVRRIKELTLLLEGIEEARYRRGTSTYTDTETFHEATFARETFHVNMRAGSAEFILPVDSMHSFKGSNNKIRWQLKLCGDIPHWPDVSETFEISVLPIEVI